MFQQKYKDKENIPCVEPGLKRPKREIQAQQLILLKVRLYTARTRTRPVRTRTRPRLLSGFAIQIEHAIERGKPSTDYKAARLLLDLGIKFGHFGIMVQV